MKVVISADVKEELTAELDEYFDTRLGPAISTDARRYCPKDTGALADSIEHHLEEHDLIVSATGGARGQIYAAYVELGTEPHIIRPKDKKALFWVGAKRPVTVVHHPGTRPRPFLRPALYQERDV